MLSYIIQDWRSNTGNRKGRVFVLAFRLGQMLDAAPRPLRWLFTPYFVFYGFLFAWVFGIEIPLRTRVGAGLIVMHGQALVVHQDAIIGRNCRLRQCTTIGQAHGAAPVIGDNVDIGSNSVVLGAIRIGSEVVIGSGAVVVHDVPDNSVVVGNPARVVRRRVPLDHDAAREVESTPADWHFQQAAENPSPRRGCIGFSTLPD